MGLAALCSLCGLKDGVCVVLFLLDKGRVPTLDLQRLPTALYHNFDSL